MSSAAPLATWPRQIDDAVAHHADAVRVLSKSIFRLEGEQAELQRGLVADLLEQLELSRLGFEAQARQLQQVATAEQRKQAELSKPAGGGAQ